MIIFLNRFTIIFKISRYESCGQCIHSELTKKSCVWCHNGEIGFCRDEDGLCPAVNLNLNLELIFLNILFKFFMFYCVVVF